jgi:uncharacterized protein (DUF849 family)
MLPSDTIWTGLGIGRSAFPMGAPAFLPGGMVSIWMEDTVNLVKGRLAKGMTASGQRSG